MNYAVLTPLRGYQRADGLKAPIDSGEVVSLPFSDTTLELIDIGAIEPVDREETCLLLWPSVEQEADLLPPIAVVAVTDRHALAAAIADLGGLVFFVGEGLPEDAYLVLADFPNEQLLEELVVRIGEKRLDPALMGTVAKMLELGDLEDDDDTAPVGRVAGEWLPPVDSAAAEAAPIAPVATDPPVAPAKPARKPKAEAK